MYFITHWSCCCASPLVNSIKFCTLFYLIGCTLHKVTSRTKALVVSFMLMHLFCSCDWWFLIINFVLSCLIKCCYLEWHSNVQAFEVTVNCQQFLINPLTHKQCNFCDLSYGRGGWKLTYKALKLLCKLRKMWHMFSSVGRKCC